MAVHAGGHSLKDIRTWSNEDGIEIGCARLWHTLGSYVAVSSKSPDPMPLPVAVPLQQDLVAEPDDRLANLAERIRKCRGFQYNSEPEPKKLI